MSWLNRPLVYCLKISSSLEFSTFGHFSADDSMNWNLQFSFHSWPHGTGLSIVNLLLDATLCEWSTHIGLIAESLFWRLCDCCRPWGFIRVAPSLESCKVHQWESTSATNPPLLEMRWLLLITQVNWSPRAPVWGRNWQQAAAVTETML